MPGAGPVKVVTDKGILEADPTTGELVLTALYPGVQADDVQRRGGVVPPRPASLASVDPPTERGSASCGMCSTRIVSTSRADPSMTATAAAPATDHPTLPRALGLRDMVLFNVVAVVSLRWLATAAAAGPSSITLWVLAAIFFFVPQGLAVSDLAARYPDEGGIYAWTKRSFGEGHGFLCGWCYWVNNILYYPNLLMSTAVMGRT